mmetsp:Transcript_49954/g.139949  ORF Transcript_49954/g.139949 Transcript_49954/m.139949 type:complete len:110 (+) Transcript_49954:32-361(+)
MKTHPNSLIKLLNGLRHFGVGSKVTRNIYKFPDTYWVITRVKLRPKNQDHGKVFGRLVWRGRPKDRDMQITSALKKQWSIVDLPDYTGSFRARDEEIDKLIPKTTERTC